MPDPVTSQLCLVTGGTGLIGSHLVQRLRAAGSPVRALVRSGGNTAWLENLDVELAQGDLCDPQSLIRAVKGASTVFHCGGLVSDWGARSEFHATNVIGTRNIARAAAKEKIHCFVHLSSASVYGYPTKGRISEHAPLRSRRIPYIESKILAEQEVWDAVRRDGLKATMLRPVMVFGPRCQNYVGEVVRHLAAGSMLLLDDGRHVAGLAYVENVVDAILQAAATPAALNQAMNVCDDLPVTWKDYIDALADGIGAQRVRFSLPTRVAYPVSMAMEGAARVFCRRQRPLLTRLAVLELGQPQVYDIGLARQLLGYTPRLPYHEAMQTTLEWVKQNQ
ncbi:NAD-dependent epimerase/dehydratase family protein [Bythopirellula polymerisocia]|uniref:3 beta-hydroxysteroid dehydrogenase/Delta 5-->4-isomerase n=1 Tax=Bythopirellula polymerisocia TaxID=2528003 RepID=A0A5C6CZH9_9BACT|nr:NAD-dependent epimerase/dehydratase family protein [Bythopirellula polymerisocia]TWU29838.1 3 beta-hydroxysteroid dehydrogenase/Delta 5-->4-isomerase [Bythopirellula polymerisocia]